MKSQQNIRARLLNFLPTYPLQMLRICVSLLATLGMGCSFVVTPSHGQPIIFQEPSHLHHSISPAIMSESLSPPAIRSGRNAGATPSIPVRKQEQTQLFQLVEEGDEEVISLEMHQN